MLAQRQCSFHKILGGFQWDVVTSARTFILASEIGVEASDHTGSCIAWQTSLKSALVRAYIRRLHALRCIRAMNFLYSQLGGVRRRTAHGVCLLLLHAHCPFACSSLFSRLIANRSLNQMPANGCQRSVDLGCVLAFFETDVSFAGAGSWKCRCQQNANRKKFVSVDGISAHKGNIDGSMYVHGVRNWAFQTLMGSSQAVYHPPNSADMRKTVGSAHPTDFYRLIGFDCGQIIPYIC